MFFPSPQSIPLSLCFILLSMMSKLSAEAHVFLLAGQSNMAGAGLFEKLKKSEQRPPENVKIWHDNQWTELGPGISANKGKFGPELAFGRAMQREFPEDKIYLIKTAAGGTSMHKHWKLEDGRGVMLRKFLAQSRTALADLDEKNEKYTIEAMLWMQGESDADQGEGAKYETRLRDFIKEMRRHFKQRELPFIMGRILPTFDKPAGNGPMVRAAQETVAEDMKNVACFDTDDFPRINKGHYNHKGQLKMGETFAKHFLLIAHEKNS